VGDWIASTRREVGWSQADLARRLGVTPASVSHWENHERNGTIRLATLDRALRAMRRRLATFAALDTPAIDVWWDRAAFAGVPEVGRGTERAAWRARVRVRTPAIVADALVERNQLSLADLWVAAEGHMIATSQVRDYWHVVDIARDYDRAVAGIDDPEWQAVAVMPDGRRIAPVATHAHPVATAIVWAATAIANGMSPRAARYLANVMIVKAGFDWLMLGMEDQAPLDRAVAMIQHGGDATAYVELMCARYDESD